MPKLRILYKNVADLATITPSTTDTGFLINNVKNTKKTSVHRSSGTTVTYTLTWTTSQKVSCVVLPATNLLDTATIQVQLYTENADTTAIANSSAVTACKDRSVLVTDYTYTQFPYIGATKTAVWFDVEYSVKKAVITVTNTTKIDCARILCGTYWESSRQVSNGITLNVLDNSLITTTRTGDVYVDRRPITESMQFDLRYLSETDRKTLLQIMQTYGTNGLLYVCVFPDNLNPEVTQAYSIYGRSQNSSIEYFMFSMYNSSLSFNSW